MIMDRQHIKRDAQSSGTQNQAMREIARHAPRNAPQKQRQLFASSSARRMRDADLRWDRLGTFPIDEAHLEAHGVSAAPPQDAADSGYDVLRRAVVPVLQDRRWKRIAVTAPAGEVNKTRLAVNLALSFARDQTCRTLLMDLDLRQPSVGAMLGVGTAGAMSELLMGAGPAHSHIRRAGQNLLGLGGNFGVIANNRREGSCAPTLGSPEAASSLNTLSAELAPDVIVLDMPASMSPDVLRMTRGLFDGILAVVPESSGDIDQMDGIAQGFGPELPMLGLVQFQPDGVKSRLF